MTTPSQNPPNEDHAIGSLCRSVADVVTLEACEIVGDAGLAILRDNGDSVDKARASLIEAVRAGKHVELNVRAITFRQKDGHPNKNHIRIKSSILPSVAASYVGLPMLIDHATYSQRSRVGTISASEAVPLAGGWTGFRQTLRVVKPDAVISVLDGTLDRFSIGWDPRGAIMCTAHKVDVRSRASCYRLEGCYPGKRVEVDGKAEIAEYEWQSTSGVETSGVNNPAVGGTKIEDIRAALSAELGAANPEPQGKPHTMRYPLLLAALAMPTLAADAPDPDDASLATKVRELAADKLAAEQERDAAIKRAELAEKKSTELETQLGALEADKVEGVLAAAYKGGKLMRGKDADGKSTPSPREVRLRKIAKIDGLPALEAELAEMPVVVPVGRAELDEADPNPRPSNGPIPSSVLASTAKQLGLKPEELSEHATLISNGKGN